jgi:hypothetical protein
MHAVLLCPPWIYSDWIECPAKNKLLLPPPICPVVIASYITTQNGNERLFLQNANEHLFLQANMLRLYLTCIRSTLKFILASALRTFTWGMEYGKKALQYYEDILWCYWNTLRLLIPNIKYLFPSDLEDEIVKWRCYGSHYGTWDKEETLKYWDLSFLQICVPVILDPRFKLGFLEFHLGQGFRDYSSSTYFPPV